MTASVVGTETMSSADYPWYLSDDFYELSDGSTVEGEAAAQQAEAELQNGEGE